MIPDTSQLYFGRCACVICGNEEPLLIKRAEWNGESYLNPHALFRFFDSSLGSDLCTECGLFGNLNINTDKSSELQTQMQPYLVVTGICLSPVFWVSLALPMDYPELILISIIAMMIATVIGVCLIMYGYGVTVKRVQHNNQSDVGKRRMFCFSTKQKSGKVKKIEEWFRGKRA